MWIIRVGDETVESDDFLIEDLANIEKSTGVPWSIANPLKEIKIAKAFLAVAMLKIGKSEKEVVEALKVVTLRDLKNTFDYKPDDAEPSEGGAPLEKKSAQTGRASRRGRPISGGSRPISDDKPLEIASSS